MENKSPKLYAGVIIMLGAAWGLSEAAMGMWLKNCASSVSGSVMTGFALFFIADSWLISKRKSGVILLVVVASLFKLLDAFLLSLPVLHGAVANPIFAFFLEGGAFLVCIALFKKNFSVEALGTGTAWWCFCFWSRWLVPSGQIFDRNSRLCRSGYGHPSFHLLCSSGYCPVRFNRSLWYLVWRKIQPGSSR